MPIDTSSTSISIFSHKFAISLINVIFVAKKALAAYLISSAALRLTETNLAPFEIKGAYKFLNIVADFLSLAPITILSG